MEFEDDQRRRPADLLANFISRYGKSLARTIARLVRPNDVEDIVQETYVRVFRAAQQHPIRSPRAFMLKTARNIVLNRLVRADALNHVAISLGNDDDGSGAIPTEFTRDEQTPDTVLESEQEFVVLCRAIRELPRQCRRAFLLKRVYGLSQREIATRMGVSEGTVEKHLHKAMTDCVLYMERSGYVTRRTRRADSAIQRTKPLRR